jgi:hypothetical protein
MIGTVALAASATLLCWSLVAGVAFHDKSGPGSLRSARVRLLYLLRISDGYSLLHVDSGARLA